jgi:hypothetical protein
MSEENPSEGEKTKGFAFGCDIRSKGNAATPRRKPEGKTRMPAIRFSHL